MACKPRAAALLVEPMSLKPGRRRGITKLRRAQHASKDAWKLKTLSRLPRPLFLGVQNRSTHPESCLNQVGLVSMTSSSPLSNSGTTLALSVGDC